MYFPAGYSSSEEEEDFLTPTTGCGPVAEPWVPAGLLSENNADLTRTEEQLEEPELARVLERTRKNLRAVLIAVKGELDLPRLEFEYRQTFEEDIPWQTLNFPSLEDLLLASPSVCEVRSVMFSTLVTAVEDNNTRHIRQLVNRQGKSKKRGGRGGAWGPSYDYDFQQPADQTWEVSLPAPDNDESADQSWDIYQSVAEAGVRSECGRVEDSGGLSEGRRLEDGGGLSAQAVWLGRLKDILTGRRFGLLTRHVERSYEREWGECLPGDWQVRTRAADRQVVFLEHPDSQTSWVKLGQEAGGV